MFSHGITHLLSPMSILYLEIIQLVNFIAIKRIAFINLVTITYLSNSVFPNLPNSPVVTMPVPVLKVITVLPYKKKYNKGELGKTKLKTSKAYSHFRHILLLRVIFGYNYPPFETSRLVGYMIKAYCVSICISTSAYTLYNLDEISFWPYVFVIAEYVITVFISCILKSSNRQGFFRRLEAIDSRLVIQCNYYKDLQKIHNIIVLVAIVTRTFYAVSFCLCFNDLCSSTNILLSNFIAMAIDVNQLPRVIIFYMLLYQMRMLRINIEKKSKYGPTDTEKVEYNTLEEYLESYKELLDNADSLKIPINSLFFLSLLFCYPKIMLLMYNILLQSNKGAPIFSIIILGVQAIQWGFLPCLPAFVTEKTASEVDKIKLHLMNQILSSYDDNEREELQRFIRYLEIRPFKYTLWRLIPIDLSLPVGLLSICTTYLIVIIQFTHLFG